MAGKKATGTTNGTQPAKFKAPCKYYKFGTCRMGEHCRFVHLEADHPSKHPHLSKKPLKGRQGQSEPPEEAHGRALSHATAGATNGKDAAHAIPTKTTASIQSSAGSRAEVAVDVALSPEESLLWRSLDAATLQRKLERLPFVHVIALDGAEQYAAKVERLLLQHSCDVLLQVASSSPQRSQSEILAALTADSHGDHLLVLAPRNARNCSCQAKDGGRLVEVKVGALIVRIWTLLAQLVPSSPANPPITPGHKYALLGTHAGVHHVEERLSRLTGDVAELVKPSSQAGKYVSDEKIAGHLTKVQRALIRFHRQVDAVRLRVDQGLAKADVASRCASSRSAKYDPAPMQLLISAPACGELQPVVGELLKRLEAIGEELSNSGATLWRGYREACEDSAAEGQATLAGNGGSSGAPNAKQLWNCPACTYENVAGAARCSICDTLAPVASEWAVTGNSAKKQRKRNLRKVNLLQESEQLEEEERRMRRIRQEQEQMQLRKQQELLQRSSAAAVMPTAASQATAPRSLAAAGSWSKQVGSQVPGTAWGAPKPQQKSSGRQFGEQFPSLGNAPEKKCEESVAGPPSSSAGAGGKGKALTKQQRRQQQRQERRQHQRQEKERRLAAEEKARAQARELELEEHRTNSATAAVAVSAASPVLESREEAEAHATLGWGLQQLDLDAAVSSPPLSRLHSSGHSSGSPVLPRRDTFSPESSPGAIGSRSPSQVKAAAAFGASPFAGEEFPDPRKRPPGFGKFMQQGFGNIWSNQYTNQPAFGMDPWAAAAPEEEEPTGLRGLQALEYGLPGSLGSFGGGAPAQQPCCYCGAESTIACPMCSQMGLSTFFCSPEHQGVVWEEHLRFHRDSTS